MRKVNRYLQLASGRSSVDSSAVTEARFGNAVAVGEEHFAVGAPTYDAVENQEGVVYVFPY